MLDKHLLSYHSDEAAKEYISSLIETKSNGRRNLNERKHIFESSHGEEELRLPQLGPCPLRHSETPAAMFLYCYCSAGRRWSSLSCQRCASDTSIQIRQCIMIIHISSSRSYRDLRQDSECVAIDNRWRFCEDTHVTNYHVPDSVRVRQHCRQFDG
ncbi:hypothetical protein ACLB2K_007287 [Fragaria x ananassa]